MPRRLARDSSASPATRRRVGGRLEPVLAGLAGVALIGLLGPWWAVYEFNTDEGINLMKGALVADGHRLYAEIWSDQPPLFTLALATLHRATGFDVAAARALVLGFAALLVASLFAVVRRSEGRAAAWLATGALAAAGMFQQLSVTVAIGLPAIALTTAALDRAHAGALAASRRDRWLAGVLLALSAQTKMFTLTALPALLATAWLPRAGAAGEPTSRQRARDLLDLLLPAAATFAVVALLAGEAFWEQLIAPHLAARAMIEEEGGAAALAREVWQGAPFATLLGVAGGLAARPWRRPARWMPTLWCVVATLALVDHRPLWSHHALLVIVPLAWWSGTLLGRAAGARSDGPSPVRAALRWRAAAIALLVLAAGAVARSGASTAAAFRRAPERQDARAAASLARFAPLSTWVLTDRAIDAYRAELLVPPPVAVYSFKRRRVGELSTAQVIDVLRAYRPEQFRLRRFSTDEALRSFLAAHYVRVGSVTPRHYLSRPAAVAGALTNAMVDLLARPAGRLGGVLELRTGRRFDRPSSDEPLAAGEIVVRPPGSAQEVGACLLRFAAQEEIAAAGRAAIGIAETLACAQNELGGWAATADVPPDCRPGRPSRASGRAAEIRLDDGATQSAVAFLLDVRSHLRRDGGAAPAWLDLALRRGLESLLAAQLPQGGWPQRFPPSRGTLYEGFATLNDGATTDSIRVLLRAARELAHEPYRAAAVRGGEFLLHAQGREPQPAWAQQYDAALQPAPARAFEPAGYSSLESAYALDALLELAIETGEARFAAPLEPARAWLERSQIAPQRWARLYAPGSNRPIYGDRDGAVRFSLAELSAERRAGYRWEGGAEVFPEIATVLRRLDAYERGGAPAVRELWAAAARTDLLPGLATAQARPARDEVEVAVATALRESRWAEGGRLSARTFVENCATLLDAQARRR